MNENETHSGDSENTIVRRVWKCNDCGKEFPDVMSGIRHFQNKECTDE